MAEECEFYYYDSDYCCRLLKNSDREYVLDSDRVHRYCWGYHYDECPYYKNRSDMSSSSGGCYLTSACVAAKNLPDDCRELQILRRFRDEYVRKTKGGQEDIQHYYLVAPKIVNAINRNSDALEVWEEIYQELIVPCVDFIVQGQHSHAFTHYKEYAIALEEKYL